MDIDQIEDLVEYVDIVLVTKCSECSKEIIIPATEEIKKCEVGYDLFERLSKPHLDYLKTDGVYKGYFCANCGKEVGKVQFPLRIIGCYTFVDQSGSVWFDADIKEDFTLDNKEYRYDKGTKVYEDIPKFIQTLERKELQSFKTIKNGDCFQLLGRVFSVIKKWEELVSDFLDSGQRYLDKAAPGMYLVLGTKEEEGKYKYEYKSPNLVEELEGTEVLEVMVNNVFDEEDNEQNDAKRMIEGFFFTDFLSERARKELSENRNIRLSVIVKRDIFERMIQYELGANYLEILDSKQDDSHKIDNYLVGNSVGSLAEIWSYDIFFEAAIKGRTINEQVVFDIFTFARKLLLEDQFIRDLRVSFPDLIFEPIRSKEGYVKVFTKGENDVVVNELNIQEIYSLYDLSNEHDRKSLSEVIFKGDDLRKKPVVKKFIKAVDFVEYYVKSNNLKDSNAMLYNFREVVSYITNGPKVVLNIYGIEENDLVSFHGFGEKELEEIKTKDQAENRFQSDLQRMKWRIKVCKFKAGKQTIYAVYGENVASFVVANEYISKLMSSLEINWKSAEVYVHSAGLIALVENKDYVEKDEVIAKLKKSVGRIEREDMGYLLTDVMEFSEVFDIKEEVAGEVEIITVENMHDESGLHGDSLEDKFEVEEIEQEEIDKGEDEDFMLESEKSTKDKTDDERIPDSDKVLTNDIPEDSKDKITMEDEIKGPDIFLKAVGDNLLTEKRKLEDLLSEKDKEKDIVKNADSQHKKKISSENESEKAMSDFDKKAEEIAKEIKVRSERKNEKEQNNKVIVDNEAQDIDEDQSVISVYGNEFLPKFAERLSKSYEEAGEWFDNMKDDIKNQLKVRRVFKFGPFFTISSVISRSDSNISVLKIKVKDPLVDFINGKEISSKFKKFEEYIFVSVLIDFLDKGKMVVWDELFSFRLAVIEEEEKNDPITGEKTTIPSHKGITIRISSKFMRDNEE